MEDKVPLDNDQKRLGELAIQVLYGNIRERASNMPLSHQKVAELVDELIRFGLDVATAKELTKHLLVNLVKSLVDLYGAKCRSDENFAGKTHADEGSAPPPPSDDDIPF